MLVTTCACACLENLESRERECFAIPLPAFTILIFSYVNPHGSPHRMSGTIGAKISSTFTYPSSLPFTAHDHQSLHGRNAIDARAKLGVVVFAVCPFVGKAHHIMCITQLYPTNIIDFVSFSIGTTCTKQHLASIIQLHISSTI